MNGLRQFIFGILAAAGSAALVLGILSAASREGALAMLPSPTVVLEILETSLPQPATPAQSTATLLPPSPTACPIPAGWTAYTVLGGDTLDTLAVMSGISADEIFRGNCLSSTTLPVGSTINLPVQFTPTATIVLPTDLPTAAPTPTFTPQPIATRVVCFAPSGWVQYTIQPGETLFSLARLFGTTVAQIRQANCLFGDTIFAGQRIFVPNVPTRTATPVPPTEAPTATSTTEPSPTSEVTPEPSPVNTLEPEPTEPTEPAQPTEPAEPSETAEGTGTIEGTPASP